ncbi:MAG: SusF/SusE family outer membrane protein [Paludibacteraceae bacterium]|nr:SusF/SusE family outer membrane protein [Paludibacteraceae bacterium]
MKKILFFLLATALFFSCERPEQPVQEEPLALTLSTDSVLCLPIYKDLPALELAWTAGTNHGTGSAISYTIEMDTVGADFAGGLKWEIGRTANRTLVLGHKQLADTLALTYPDIPEGQFTSFEWRVRAKVLMSGEEQVSEPQTVRMAWRAAMLTDLYLVGDATPNGWNLGRATPMIIDMTTLSSFSWTGQMHKGEFKFLLTDSTWLPCYVRDTLDENKMIYRPTEETYPDMKWYIPKTGNYRIEADVEALTMTVTYLGGEAYSHVYMIGDATPGGWSWDNITELQHPEANIFTYQGMLSAGELKFPTELKSDWSGEMLYAPTPDCAPTENGTFEARTGGADNKWRITVPGQYQIRINFNDTTISFVKL